MSTDTDIQINEKIKKKTMLPPKYKVVFLNDNVTPIDWVILVLTTIFKHSQESATEITLKIHNEGSAVVGIYTYEIAEQKSVEATTQSRDKGFPLQIKLEEDQ
jgi:ATP-dependent Clp protease adaptor protein ClpS